jgi:hypothetical protein
MIILPILSLMNVVSFSGQRKAPCAMVVKVNGEYE